MRVRDLGPLLVERSDGEQPCSGAKQAAILATLTMNVNRRVANDDLIVAAWGYDASVSTSTLENHVWRLRQLLDPTHGRTANSSLLNESGGYRLVLASDAVDSLVFEDLAKRSRAMLADGDAFGALHSCEAALSLWRGDPYEAVGHTTAASAATAKITELREQMIERRVDALLAVGDVSGALADLQLLTTQHPFRERLWAQLMTALARSGRVEEALQIFQRVRSLMRGELGVEPGPELQRLHMQILAQETEREPNARERASGPASTGVRVPRPTSLLVGREYELAELESWLTSKPLVTITGPGGSGKTRLAIEVALASVKRFADGVWFVDLTTVTDSRLVVDAITSTLGLVVGDRTPLETIVDYVRARQLLLVIDNCEHVLEGIAETAEALRGDGSGSVLLTTSREPLDVGREAVWELDPLPLEADTADPGAPPAATQLFVARMAGPPGPDDLPLIGQICEAVDGLPLAIELAAARTRWFSLAEIIQQVTDDPSRLTRIGRGPADHRTTLWNAIEWSHRLLTRTEQAIHRRLSVLPGPFTLPVATAVTQGNDLDVGDIPGGLARLAHRSLLMSSRATQGGRPSVFRQLDTVRAHARHHLSEIGETAASLERRDSWVRQLLAARPRLGDPSEPGWYDAIDDTYSIVRATLQTAVRPDPDLRLLRLGSQLIYYWYYRRRVIEARHWLEDVLATMDAAATRDAASVEVTMARLALAVSACSQARWIPPCD
jgi:pentatricopeptide repeat protein